MSAKPSAKVVPITVSQARRAKGGHQIARKSAVSALDTRVAQLEKIVAALDQRMAHGGFNRPFQMALAASIILHVVVISLVTFKMPDTSKDYNDKPLEVVLVNAKSKTKPVKAQALAQHNLDGGGNTDADRRAKSPLPVLRNDPLSTDVAVAQRRVEQLEQEVRQVMTRQKSKTGAPSAVPQPTPQTETQRETPPSPTQDEIQRSLNIQRLEAEVSKLWDSYQKRPRRHSIGASASEYRFARYVEDWRQKIELIGETNYPQAARNQKIYGSLLLTVSIKSNGAIENIEMRRSSGNKLLDEAAKNIVRMGAPYAPFPPDIAKDTDVIDISRTWRFTSSDRLETE
jgi:periplasmic protein TonB